MKAFDSCACKVSVKDNLGMIDKIDGEIMNNGKISSYNEKSPHVWEFQDAVFFFMVVFKSLHAFPG